MAELCAKQSDWAGAEQAYVRLARLLATPEEQRAIYEKPRPGAAALLNVNQRSRILAMVSGAPPSGYARWTVRLIAEEAVRRRLVPTVGRETIRMLLLHNDMKPWRQKDSQPEER